MKMKQKLGVLFLVAILALVLTLAACGGGGGEEARALRANTIEFDDLEIVFHPDDIGYTRVRERFSDHNGAYVFYIPVTVTNTGTGGNSLQEWFMTIYSPEGRAVDELWSWYFEETNIFAQGNVLQNVTKEGHLYVLYNGDGEYVIAFDNFAESADWSITIEFDFDAVPEHQTEFSLGETFVIEGLEITFQDNISWGTIRSRHSNFDGEHYFYLPVALHNASDTTQSFPFSVETFAPNGQATERISWDVEGEDITRSNDLLPGARDTGYLHILYSGDGTYTIHFHDWTTGDDIQVIFLVNFDADAVPVFQTEFTLGESFVFEDMEITFEDDFIWGTVDSQFSDLHGHPLFAVAVTAVNVGSSANSFPSAWSITVFGPDGHELDDPRISDDITRAGNVLPGATLSGYFHILFEGDGTYTLQFSNWSDTITLVFDAQQ